MENTKPQKIVALIGRPNVGKSTLFNRLVGRRIAIETPVPGTTRDRLYGDVSWGGEAFTLLDVAGIETGSKKEIDQSIQEGIEVAINSADLILFLTDWQDKDNEADKSIARNLRKYDKKVILVINKVDNAERERDIDTFKRLGSFDIVPVSAISGKSSGDLLDKIVAELKKIKSVPKKIKEKSDINLAIIGRPNTGKSTLLNTIIGEKRAVVSEEQGTTRDIVSVAFSHKGKRINISDTAGLRRPGKVDKGTIEGYSVLRSYGALKRSDIAILIIDATEGLVALDANILGKAKEWGKGIVLAINKTDLIPGDKEAFMAQMIWELQTKLNFAPWLPAVFISAEKDENIKPLLNQVIAAFESRSTILRQEDLDFIAADIRNSNSQLVGLKNIIQKKANPPIFEISFSGKKIPHYTQVRYIENKIRDFKPLNGTPLFIDLARKP